MIEICIYKSFANQMNYERPYLYIHKSTVFSKTISVKKIISIVICKSENVYLLSCKIFYFI